MIIMSLIEYEIALRAKMGIWIRAAVRPTSAH